MTPRATPWSAVLAAFVGLSALAPVQAGADTWKPVRLLPAYRNECGTCHAPYPPGLLPAASWQRLMGTLPHHYGADASLDAPAAAALSAWLAANAAVPRRSREAPAQDRITRSRWFVREHDEVPPAAWTSAAVKSPANCGACHAQAADGDFDERRVRIPR